MVVKAGRRVVLERGGRPLEQIAAKPVEIAIRTSRYRPFERVRALGLTYSSLALTGGIVVTWAIRDRSGFTRFFVGSSITGLLSALACHGQGGNGVVESGRAIDALERESGVCLQQRRLESIDCNGRSK